MLAQFKMVTNVHETETRLTEHRYPDITVRSMVLEGESHTSVVAGALLRRLRALLAAR